MPKGLTVYKGFNDRCYYRDTTFEQVVRFFPNTHDNLFVNSILWEQLCTSYRVLTVHSEKCVFIEYKDVTHDEFSHWYIAGLSMGVRKRD